MSDSSRPHGLQAPLFVGFSRQEYWSRLPFPFPGNFPTQGSNPGLPHCRQTLYHLSHQGMLWNQDSNPNKAQFSAAFHKLLSPFQFGRRVKSLRKVCTMLTYYAWISRTGNEPPLIGKVMNLEPEVTDYQLCDLRQVTSPTSIF